MAAVGLPIWTVGVWADTVWAAGVWESGDLPVYGDGGGNGVRVAFLHYFHDDLDD